MRKELLWIFSFLFLSSFLVSWLGYASVKNSSSQFRLPMSAAPEFEDAEGDDTGQG